MSDETIEKTFAVTAPARLNLANIRGSVEIRPGAEGVIRVTTIKRTDTGDARNTEIELAQHDDGTVVAAARFPDGWWSWLLFSQPCKVDFIVTLPREAQVKLNGVSNQISVAGLRGEVSINTVSGDVSLQDVEGRLKVKSVSGDVSASHCAGALELTTVSGDADFHESRLASVSAHTTSGDLDFETVLSEGPYRFKSVSGNVELRLPPETPCSAQLHSISGRIQGEYPMTTRAFGQGSHHIDISGGGTPVEVHSVSGDLRLRVSGNLPAASANRRAVLEQLARGEISPDQALAGLKG
jgi:hypothetical protein